MHWVSPLIDHAKEDEMLTPAFTQSCTWSNASARALCRGRAQCAPVSSPVHGRWRGVPIRQSPRRRWPSSSEGAAASKESVKNALTLSKCYPTPYRFPLRRIVPLAGLLPHTTILKSSSPTCLRGLSWETQHSRRVPDQLRCAKLGSRRPTQNLRSLSHPRWLLAFLEEDPTRKSELIQAGLGSPLPHYSLRHLPYPTKGSSTEKRCQCHEVAASQRLSRPQLQRTSTIGYSGAFVSGGSYEHS
ncbi:hypothetical protein C8Q70DRAFT_633966 [Cubamyces menziesii]|nr:hypothetical protein C8Q70DRAFT_633966 [Cubamyces menziesii]